MEKTLDKEDAARRAGRLQEAEEFRRAHDALEQQLDRIFDLRDDYLRSTRSTGEAEARLAAGRKEAEKLLRRLRKAESFLNAAAKIADRITDIVGFLKGLA